MPKLSVIVPVYNVEKYLNKCIDSILNQSFTDFELILIDDGSPDRCGDICDRYAEKDCRIIVIHQNNAGVSAARNAGLRIANGKLLSFVDADDYLHPHMYEIMIAAMTESHSDIGVCDFQSFAEEENVEFSEYTKQGFNQLSAEEYIAKLCSIPPTFYNVCWNKIFDRNCIMEKFDTNLSVCEDAKFLIQNLKADSKICFVPNKLYYVFARQGSATRSNAAFFLKEPAVRKDICEIIKRRFPKLYPIAYNLYIDRCFHVVSMQERKTQEEKKAIKYLTESIIGLGNIKEFSVKERSKYFFLYLKVVLLGGVGER